MAEWIFVRPNDVCGQFDRAPWSLIEEPEICDLCRYYVEDGSKCSCEARIAAGN